MDSDCSLLNPIIRRNISAHQSSFSKVFFRYMKLKFFISKKSSKSSAWGNFKNCTQLVIFKSFSFSQFPSCYVQWWHNRNSVLTYKNIANGVVELWACKAFIFRKLLQIFKANKNVKNFVFFLLVISPLSLETLTIFQLSFFNYILSLSLLSFSV